MYWPLWEHTERSRRRRGYASPVNFYNLLLTLHILHICSHKMTSHEPQVGPREVEVRSSQRPSFMYGVPIVHLIFRTPNGHLCAKRQKMADFLRTIAHLVRGIQLSFSRVSRTHSLCVRISTSFLRTYRPLVCACFHGLIWAECTFVIPLFLCTGWWPCILR